MKTTTFLWLLLLLVIAWSCKQEEDFSPRSQSISSPEREASSSTSLLAASDISLNLIPNGVYFIQPMAHPELNLRLDVPNGSTADKVIIQQFGFNGAMNQQWRVTKLPDDYYSIVNIKSGKALDVPNGSPTSGVKIQQFTPNGGYNQQWRIAYSISKGTCWITNRQSGLRLDIPDGLGAQGVQLQQFNANTGSNQIWRFRTN